MCVCVCGEERARACGWVTCACACAGVGCGWVRIAATHLRAPWPSDARPSSPWRGEPHVTGCGAHKAELCDQQRQRRVHLKTRISATLEFDIKLTRPELPIATCQRMDVRVCRQLLHTKSSTPQQQSHTWPREHAHDTNSREHIALDNECPGVKKALPGSLGTTTTALQCGLQQKAWTHGTA